MDDLVAQWHPNLRRALAESDPESRGAGAFTASTEVPAWSSTNVTVLGDAIHTMPPVGGLGGNTALRDARLLCRMLTSVDRGERELRAPYASTKPRCVTTALPRGETPWR